MKTDHINIAKLQKYLAIHLLNDVKFNFRDRQSWISDDVFFFIFVYFVNYFPMSLSSNWHSPSHHTESVEVFWADRPRSIVTVDSMNHIDTLNHSIDSSRNYKFLSKSQITVKSTYPYTENSRIYFLSFSQITYRLVDLYPYRALRFLLPFTVRVDFTQGKANRSDC